MNDIIKTNQSKRKSSSYFVDRKLLPRIREYLDLSNHRASETVDDVLDYLQTSFPEYGRRKQHTLRLSVVKAVSILKDTREEKITNMEERYLKKRQKSLDNTLTARNDNSDDSDFSLNDEPLVEYKDSNAINNVMHNLYTTRSNTQSPMTRNTNEDLLPFIVDKDGEEGSVNSNALSMVVDKLQETRSPGLLGAGSQNHQLTPNSISCNKFEHLEKSTLQPISEDDRSVPPSRPGTPSTKSLSRSSSKKAAGTKEKAKKFQPTISNVSFKDIGGYSSSMKEISKLLFHLKHPEVFKTLGIKPPRGFLLYGPPGCGKTLLANAIAGELKLPFFKVASTEVVSGISGETEQKIRSLFMEAISAAPSILFIDEIDSITPKRESAGKEMERRIVTQILTCLDEVSAIDANVLVIGATNRADALDPALRRAGRFDREIALGIPDLTDRVKILKVLCSGLRLFDTFNYEVLARQTPGFVGADLQALIREAAMCAVNSIFESFKEIENVSKTLFSDKPADEEQGEKVVDTCSNVVPSSWLSDNLPISEEQLNSLYITNKHFEEALPNVQPSSKREGFATVPDVSWEDIGALEDIREELQMAIMAPVQNPLEFESLGLTTPPGILLAGPPGCGKTLLAKAVANEAGINFISVKGPELLNMYVGESERAVRQVFERARNSSPCVIFFDEIDALCPRRSHSGDSTASSRVVNQLLTEMDGLQARKQVFIMGATNRPDILDRAILRPGRLDKLLYVGLPNAADRIKIMKAITKNGRKPCLHPEVSIEALADDPRCNGYSGADINALIREASVTALREYMSEKANTEVSCTNKNVSLIEVQNKHFDIAYGKVKPSVSEKDQKLYDKMKEHQSVA